MPHFFRRRVPTGFWLVGVLAALMLAGGPAAAQEDARPAGAEAVEAPSVPETGKQAEAAPAATGAEAQPADAPQAAAAAAAEAAPAPQPAQVVTGIYINDIQDIDFKANSFSADFYVWFRWRAEDVNPPKSMEFMNRFQPDDHLRESLYDEPKAMPDGSRYAIIRSQGRFSSKFQLENYPFDRQKLTIVFEDTVTGSGGQIYTVDTPGVTLNPGITLPGFRIGTPELRVEDNAYTTNFGDLSVGEAESYSRASVVIPVSRPLGALSLKTFVPVLLIILCAALALLIRPHYVDGRIGLAITALLTLVALQLTSGSGLPDVDYLMMLDKVYLVSYAFIMLVLWRVAATSWRVDESTRELAVAKTDRRMVLLLGLLYILSVAGLGGWSLSLFLRA